MLTNPLHTVTPDAANGSAEGASAAAGEQRRQGL